MNLHEYQAKQMFAKDRLRLSKDSQATAGEANAGCIRLSANKSGGKGRARLRFAELEAGGISAVRAEVSMGAAVTESRVHRRVI